MVISKWILLRTINFINYGTKKAVSLRNSFLKYSNLVQLKFIVLTLVLVTLGSNGGNNNCE